MANRRYKYARKRKTRRPLVLDIFITVLFFGLLAVLVTLLNAYNPQEFGGNAWVIDGDTIVMDGAKLRLSGIDAPELSQQCNSDRGKWACGQASKTALRKMLLNQQVNCVSGGYDRYDRSLVVCTVGGKDINAALVEGGWAVDYGGYRREEKNARAAKRGIWKGAFEKPQEWRRANRGDVLGLPHGQIGWKQISLKWVKSWFK